MYPDDEQYESVFEERMADHFAEAVARLEDGESVDSILASYPADEAIELRGMLLMSEFMVALQHAPLPIRSVEHKALRREQFMEQVLLERTRAELDQPVRAPLAQPAARSAAPRHRTQAAGQPAGRSAAPVAQPLGWWAALQQMFTVGNMRLAPVILVLAFALTGALGLWQATNASLPGDLTYPIKSWVQMMNLSLSDPAQRGAVSAAAAETIQAEFAQSAQRAEERAAAGAALEGVVHQETVFLVFEGYDGRLLKFGDIRVVPSYQPDPDDASTAPMVVEGDLQPGDEVWLTVQILPGQADVVQGVRAVVQAESAAPPPAATQIPCTPRRPAGWGNYTVVRGDTLSMLALRSSAGVREIVRANCLESDVIIRGQLLFLPLSVVPVPTGPATPAPGGTVPLPTETQ